MSPKKSCLFLASLIFSNIAVQAQSKDSLHRIEEVQISTFRRSIPYLRSTSSLAHLHTEQLRINNPERLLEAVNLIPGSKVEERSPGSYRVSLRGSTLRSPFGVRNVKIYLDEFILTDASGNSYLNIVDPQLIQTIDILKGPQGGEMGNETGGVIILQTANNEDLSIDLSTGNYQMFSEKFNLAKQLNKHYLQISQSHYQTDSYREQSAVNRKTFFFKDRWNYKKENLLDVMAMYSDLKYETPGGLNESQVSANRKQARLATAALPGAIEQQAAIYNKTFLAGLSHLWKINPNWSQFAMLQTSMTDFKNPFISNYELRDENNIQGRFYMNYDTNLGDIGLQTRVGSEFGNNNINIENYDNDAGIRGDRQKFDDLETASYFYYITQYTSFSNKLFLDASLSLHTLKYNWETTYPNQEKGKISFQNQWLPNVGMTYKLRADFSVRAKVGKGTSNPTTEEIRSSNQSIAQNLVSEYGWNKEFGVRKRFGSLFFETTLFDYDLKDAIVRRQDAGGNDYFINAGGTKQFGVEFMMESNRYQFHSLVIKSLKFMVSGTFYDFNYDGYQVAGIDYSGLTIPGTSNTAAQALLSVDLLKSLTADYTNYYNSSQYLNDANTIKEGAYIVGNIKLNHKIRIGNYQLNLYAAVNNLYNTVYNSGFDLNAFGSRYYNPAATRNFYVGTKFSL